jgi:hypothetical protein
MSTYVPTNPQYLIRRQRVLDAMARRKATGDPTPEEIAATCLEIQATWSRCERRRRSPFAAHWTPQEWRTVDFCDG